MDFIGFPKSRLNKTCTLRTLQSIRDIPGHIFEFGVYKAASFGLPHFVTH